VSETPTVRYTRAGGVHVAYQVAGRGPVDLVFIPGLLTHLELCWEDGRARQFLERLASFSRLIIFDKRGQGLSDREGPFTLEARVDDVRAVMDAAGSTRAVVLGFSEGGPIAMLFAGMYPERVSALVLASTTARASAAPGYPAGVEAQRLIDGLAHFAETAWGEGRTLELLAPELAGSDRARRIVGRWERMAASPNAIPTFAELWQEVDVRQLLPALRVPTLVIQRTNDLLLPPCHGRYLAEHIPTASYVEVPGGNHILWSDADQVVDEIERFLGGRRPPVDADRVLATVLFTDIVNSTGRAADLGDRRWRRLLDSHDAALAAAVDTFRGRVVQFTGDGAVATFDGPGRAVRCADAIRGAAHELGIEIRAGVHIGEIEARGEDIGGIAVHIAQRVCAVAGAGEIMVSSTIKDLVVGSGLGFLDTGLHELRGVPDRWRLFRALV